MTPDLVYASIVVLTGYLILGVTGFGSSLFIVPLLSWQWPLPHVVALALLLDIPASVMFGGLNFKQVDFGELLHLLPGMAVGSVAGFALQGSLDPRWPVLALGLYIAGVGVRAFLRSRPHRQTGTRWRPVAGFAAGFIEVMFATAGPVVLAWLQRRLSDVHAVRATTPATIVVCATTAVATIALHGTMGDPQLWTRWAGFLVLAIVGVAAGNHLARSIPAQVLAKLVCGMLVASGVSLAIRAIA